MDINVKVKFESPEIMAALLAFAEALPQMKFGTVLKLEDGQVVQASGTKGSVKNETKIEDGNKQLPLREGNNVQVKEITLEDVRAKLVMLSQKGKQEQVKALIKKFGGSKLTEVAKENYEDLLKEAEVL